MRTVKITDLITLSFERTKQILFQPFDLKKWLKLLFIAFMAGVLSGGGCQGNSGPSEKKAEATTVFNEQINTETPVSAVDLKSVPGDVKQKINDFLIGIAKPLYEFSQSHPIMWIVLIIGLVILFIVLMFVMTWLSARFKFVFLNSVILNNAQISAPFKEYRKEGNSLYQVSLVMVLSFIILFTVLAIWMFLSMDGSGKINFSNPMTMVKLITVVVISITAIFLATIWSFVVEHFVTPIMLIDRQTYLPSWQKFIQMYISQRGEFWLYLIVMVGMGIVMSLAQGVLLFGAFILGALLVGIIYGVGYLLFLGLLKAKILFIGFAIGAGIPLFIVGVIILLSIFLPFAIFIRVFSLYFLSSLNEGYAPLAIKD